MSSSQTVDIRAAAGGAEFVGPPGGIVETTGKDISGDVIRLSLGTETHVGAWRVPDYDPARADKASRTPAILVGPGGLVPVTGVYWLWSQVADTPEVIVRRHQKVIILADA